MQTATFVVQIQKLRHIVGIPCKTHPDILFCLFGHSQFQTVGGQMLLGSHSRGEGYGRESLNHKSLCWGKSPLEEFIIRAGTFILKT